MSRQIRDLIETQDRLQGRPSKAERARLQVQLASVESIARRLRAEGAEPQAAR